MSFRTKVFELLFKKNTLNNYSVGEQIWRGGSATSLGYSIYSYADLRNGDGIDFVVGAAAIYAGDRAFGHVSSTLSKGLIIGHPTARGVISSIVGKGIAFGAGFGVGTAAYEALSYALRVEPAGDGSDFTFQHKRYDLNKAAAHFLGEFTGTTRDEFSPLLPESGSGSLSIPDPIPVFANPEKYRILDILASDPASNGGDSRVLPQRVVVFDIENSHAYEFGTLNGHNYVRNLATKEVFVQEVSASSTDNPWVLAEHSSADLSGLQELPPGANDELAREIVDAYKNEKTPLYEQHCFVASTPINLSDGTQKPIEQVEIGDEVLAYDATDRDGQGDLSPRRVTRTYATPDKLVIDFHGLKVTPGHVFLCGDGEFAGQHRMLMEILRSDGTIVSADGTVLRAATNAPVDSQEDAFVQVAYLTDGNDALMQSGRMRAGTLILTPEGGSKTVLACLEEDGYHFDAQSGLIAKDGEEPHALYWYGEIPRPEDYVLKRSELTDADLYAEPGYQPEIAASAAPSKLGRGITPAEGTLHATAAKQAGETIH